jgi:stalled ribosome rescue protein Dom34
MAHYHAVVWIDHQKATAWHFTPTQQENAHIRAHDQNPRVHSRKSTHGGHKSPADQHFFAEVAQEITGAHEILLMGPAQTKHEFAVYLHDKHPQLAAAIVAVESADHPTDAQILSYARKHFPALERMQ